MAERALEAARESGLVRAGEPLLVLLSGGADSTCLLDVCARLGAAVSALHVNYGLRPGAGADEEHCRELCGRLGVELAVERAGEPPREGNLQAWARELRYGLAERYARDDYATAHTMSDQAETVLYRLAVSPGRRALLGMEPRRGRLVRPLLEATREDTVAYCRERGLDWREDPSNRDPRFARTRIRHDVLPALRELSPGAERTIAETARLLRDEAEVLDRSVDDALERLGEPAVPVAELRREPPALARLVLLRLAERVSGGAVALSRDDADAMLRLGERGGSASLDLGGGLRAVVEYGVLRFTQDPADTAPPEPVPLSIPGVARFGAWEVEARLLRPDRELEPSGAEEAVVSAEALGRAAIVRSWRPGDRMRPVGLGGTKTLQDLFTDRKVPRELRRSLPVVEAEGGIAWVAGVAVDERFASVGAGDLIGLTARRTRPTLAADA
jgi:tRNA(Ile)-lysidine synthase